MAATFPRLGQKEKTRGHQRQGIYFGVLRHWSSAELKDYLADLTEQQEFDAVGHQIIEMARHNWAKHRWIQISLILASAGIFVVSFAVAAALS